MGWLSVVTGWLPVSIIPTTCGKVVYIFCGFIFQVKKRKKEKTMNINSKRKKNPGKEIKHTLFFIVGKLAILSTFFDWRKSMYSEV